MKLATIYRFICSASSSHIQKLMSGEVEWNFSQSELVKGRDYVRVWITQPTASFLSGIGH